MSTPRELLAKRDELAQRVAEGELGRTDAIATLQADATKHPELLGKLAADWADVQIDRGIKKYERNRDKKAFAQMLRDLAERGQEAPRLDGTVPKISAYDETYGRTLADEAGEINKDLAAAWRWVKSRERDQERHEQLVMAAGGNMDLTKEQALDRLKMMPEEKRRSLIRTVKAELLAERLDFALDRYRGSRQAAEG